MADTDRYAGKDDAQVLEMAKKALQRRTELPIGSIEREIARAEFDSHMMELDRRAVNHVLAAIREQDGR